ncbi:MAG: LPXTG cell wall anchor domain-containing protein, partial [bacterium]|nr:LPXTG cell wall anchor domain-containing protein [bacterium]
AWTLTANGAGGTPTNLSGTDPVNSNVTYSDASFEADTYTLAESGGPADYDASVYSCVTNGGGAVVSNSITLAAGDDAVCTITNTFNPPSSGGSSSGSRPRSVSAPATLHVIKQVVNNNGGTLTASAFNLRVKLSGTDVLGSPAAGTASPGTSYTLDSGTYMVSEDFANGYVQSFSGDCDSSGSVTLSSGDDETCTITNDDIAPGVVSPTPGLPKTGFPPEENNALFLAILSGISMISIFLYFARKKQTT